MPCNTLQYSHHINISISSPSPGKIVRNTCSLPEAQEHLTVILFLYFNIAAEMFIGLCIQCKCIYTGTESFKPEIPVTVSIKLNTGFTLCGSRE